MPQWLLLQGYLLVYPHPVGGQWSVLSHWMIYSSSRHQTLLLHWYTTGVDSLDYSDEWLAFECRRVGFFKTVGFLMEEATFNAVYAARTVRSRSPATATNISDNSNHKIHIQFRIWMSISFVLGCEIQLRFSWQIISKASVITGPRPFSARNWITAHRKLENRQVKRNILKKNTNGQPFQQKAVT